MAASECHCVSLTASPSPVISRAAYSYTQVWLEAKNHHFLVSHQLLVHLIIVVCTTKLAFWKFQKCLLFGFNENQPELKDVKYALILFYFFVGEVASAEHESKETGRWMGSGYMMWNSEKNHQKQTNRNTSQGLEAYGKSRHNDCKRQT